MELARSDNNLKELTSEEFAGLCYAVLLSEAIPPKAFDCRFSYKALTFRLIHVEDCVEFDILIDNFKIINID